jgi:aryl-alcohol dehydrogenase-like predicted oxidoreductase
MAQIAIVWVLSKPMVTAPIVGATKIHHVAEAAAALEIQLTEDEIRHLEEPHTTRPAYLW